MTDLERIGETINLSLYTFWMDFISFASGLKSGMTHVCLRLALPLAPTIAIAYKDCVRGVNIGPGIEG